MRDEEKEEEGESLAVCNGALGRERSSSISSSNISPAATAEAAF